MYNYNNRFEYDYLFIHKTVNITGPITVKAHVIHFGYNEIIDCDNAETAIKLATAITNELNR